MENNKKRIIGRTTFGFALILFGITIVIQTITTLDILRYILMLWPLIIISLGIEIIYYSNKEDIQIKYDFGGIILTGIIIFSGIGFSILNYGVNKILYNQNVLQQEKELYTTKRFDSAIDIININDMPIDLKIIENPNYKDITKANIQYTIKPSTNTNLLELFDDYNYSLDKFLDTYNLDKDVATLEIENLPNYFQSIKITILTDSAEKISTDGNFNNL